MLLAGLETLVMRDGAVTVVERITRLDDVTESLAGADIDVVVAVVDDARRFALPTASDGDGVAHRWVLLVDADPRAMGEWVQRGARAVLPRDAASHEILAAIDAVAAGLVAFPDAVVQALALGGSRAAPRLAGSTTNGAPAPSPTSLSPREREILALVAEGMGNKIVAARLGISEHTVKTHVASIFEKLGADTRAEAVAIGARSGLILL